MMDCLLEIPLMNNESNLSGSLSVDVGIEDRARNALVTSCAVRRPDGQCALLVLNKDRETPIRFELLLKTLAGPDIFPAQFAWLLLAANNTFGSDATVHADANLPPVVSSIDASRQTVFTLPKASVSVLLGEVEGLTH